MLMPPWATSFFESGPGRVEIALGRRYRARVFRVTCAFEDGNRKCIQTVAFFTELLGILTKT